MRTPVVAGQFYPGTAERLRETIRGMVDESVARQDAIGLVVPHAGYVYSGAVAGAVLSRVILKDTVIIIGPNHTGAGVPVSIMPDGSWSTPLGEVEIDAELGEALLKKSRYLKKDSLAHQFEHAVEVQLPFLQYLKPGIRFVPIILSQAGDKAYKELGREIAETVRQLNKEVTIIASSDMTHYERQESARSKDQRAIEAILNLDEDALLKRVREFDISMCGYAPAVVLISAAKELGASSAELVKYQTSGDVNGDFSSVVGYAGIIIGPGAKQQVGEASPLVELARETVETYVKSGKTPMPPEAVPALQGKAGVFVTLHKFGDLRGCIGTFEPQTENIAQEIITNAVSSATRDPRFPPVRPEELKDLDYSVDVLTSPELVQDVKELDPKKYGIIVQSGYRRGLLLPDLEGVDTVAQQINICRQKAGIGPDEPVKLYRFEVKRYEE